ncbi:sodium:solute symporter family protein [Halioxenophilus sp. WMMB6]|uniref:sodium:solute symporter family protein n=1 Tax=Halioxenophilus sp. WMMB6 TaxID=3073815 RepID=UPI00295F5823|nr:sodium:solute symporter family protein [Halioxenophilus sp. WMMB6]
MTPELFKYLLCGVYVVIIYWLSWVGMRRTRDIRSFSIGNKDMGPVLIGITFAASVASTATFVINPGFVYVHGLSAFIHYGIAASLGIACALIILSRRFLRVGTQHQALTIPDWIYHRYQHRGFSLFFALINLLSITFVVLILVGCSLLMTGLFPISQKAALVIVLVFVFSYVLMGGTYAHAYTNTLQGIMMLVIAVALFVQGIGYFDGGFFSQLQSVGVNYAKVFNPDSNLYFSFFSVFISGFIVTFALMLQPHILTKVLYIKSEADVNRFIFVAVLVGFCFSLMLAIGFYARLSGLEIEQQDSVVREYLLSEFSHSTFGQYLLTFVFITLLAAGMSTLDGILVALSAMVVKDIVVPLTGDHSRGLQMSRWVLVGVGVIGGVIAWQPPALIGLFAQKGVYGLAAASFVPILLGVMSQRQLPVWLAFSAAVLALVTHLLLNLAMGVTNPAVSASYAILLSMAYSLVCLIFVRSKKLEIIQKNNLTSTP